MEVSLSQPLPQPDPPLHIEAAGSVWHLRQWAASDVDALVVAWHDSAVAAFNVVPPDPSAERAEEWIAGAERRRRAGTGLDLVVANEGDVAVGEVGVADHRPERKAAQISWWLLPAARGLGVATAAVTALSEWALGPGGLVLLAARCAPGNDAAYRVAERSGFTHAQTDRTGHRVYVRKQSD